MEEYIYLPVLENGVIIIGDLWDSSTSQRLGFNVFGSTLLQERMKDIISASASQESAISELYHKRNSEDTANNLSIGAEVTAELLGGLIKISGGLDFELGWNNGMSTEEIQRLICQYNTKVQLISAESSTFRPYMDPHVVNLLKKGR